MIRYIPNLLTVSRFFFGTYGIICFLNHRYILTTILFVISYLTDHIDGRVARYLNATSQLGKILDMVADVFIFLCLCFIFYTINPSLILSFGPNILNHTIKFFYRREFHIDEVEMSTIDNICARLNVAIFPAVVFLSILYPPLEKCVTPLLVITMLVGVLAAYQSFRKYQQQRLTPSF